MVPIDLRARQRGGSDPDSSSISSSIASRAPTEHNLKSVHHCGNLRRSSSRGSLTAASSLSDLLAYEQIHVESQSDPLMQKPLVQFEEELRSSRPAFLSILKGIGLNKLSDRQRVANALSALLKERGAQVDTHQPESSRADEHHLGPGAQTASASPVCPPVVATAGEAVVVTPGDPHVWFTPFNWLVSPDALDGEPGAIAVCPGAYLRLDWEGEYGAPLALVIDSSAAKDTFIAIACARNDGKVERVILPHGETHARVELPMLGGGPSREPVEGGNGRERHQLWLCLDSSKQKLDRWGEVGTLPVCSLRIRHVLLPPGATPVAPRLRPLRMLVFGDSIVEGVAAEYQPSKMGDLHNNAAHRTFVAAAARRVDAEYSSVGYGRQGWTVPANGNVPPFAGVRGEGSWQRLWVGAPRQFSASGGPHVDMIFVSHGTCDGLIAGPPCAANVRLAVAAFLRRLRAEVHSTTKIFLCVPFGGFGGNLQAPRGALYSGYHQYMSGGVPKKQLETNSSDPYTFYLQFGKDAALNLEGFKLDSAGIVKSSRESFDGVHPFSCRHGELGDMLVDHVRSVLKGAPLASSSMQDGMAEREPVPVQAESDHEADKHEQPLQQMMKSVGGLLRALTDTSTDHRGGGFLDGCGLPPATKLDSSRDAAVVRPLSPGEPAVSAGTESRSDENAGFPRKESANEMEVDTEIEI
ncbi:hypothetical protein AB1Y20_007596 [Prymnesium parvum]|uniref:Uncharacterized protein n=1 Tax=Prymnesium parvum TaxID=97485 RepID=A0AB34IY80_PRYPA